MSVRTSRGSTTYSRTLPRDGYHQAACETWQDGACTCNLWWRSREHVAQKAAVGYVRLDDGPPYGEEIPPTDDPPEGLRLTTGAVLIAIRAGDAATPEWVG